MGLLIVLLLPFLYLVVGGLIARFCWFMEVVLVCFDVHLWCDFVGFV